MRVPNTLDEFLWDKRHISGWVPVDLQRELDPADPHWQFCAIVTAIFIFVPAYYEVYPRIRGLELASKNQQVVTEVVAKVTNEKNKVKK